MLSQSIHQQNAVLGTALRGQALRIDSIQNNIANAETPRFTAKRVEFESALSDAISEWRNTGNLDLTRAARPTVSFQDFGTRYRLDGNNVDIEREMVALFSESVRYDVMVNSVLHNSRLLNTVMQGR
ncbi:MAG: flagellar basal body rod protein FlgB [Defluviitaleaceae bacterium]|nr:flagellar basal body rod protein FlgB [Defluviitaleaceae bacterium]MCL2261781.1 flagellar basal body rod protein FlgB [Defluviitaleaceae bacterium]